MSKKITIQLDINKLDENKLESISSIIEAHKGKKSLHFTVYDMKEEVKVNLPSRSKKINISNEFLSILDKESLKYKLN
jgi:DNA polymerase-3 subunit alpha